MEIDIQKIQEEQQQMAVLYTKNQQILELYAQLQNTREGRKDEQAPQG